MDSEFFPYKTSNQTKIEKKHVFLLFLYEITFQSWFFTWIWNGKAINPILLTVVKTDVFGYVCVSSLLHVRTWCLIELLFTRHAFPSRFRAFFTFEIVYSYFVSSGSVFVCVFEWRFEIRFFGFIKQKRFFRFTEQKNSKHKKTTKKTDMK